MKPFLTKRLRIRILKSKDVTNEYLSALNDWQIVKFTEARHRSWDIRSLKKYIKESNVKGKSLLVGIFLKNTNEHIGNIRLFNFHPIHLRAELGIMIHNKNHWGKGYGQEALSTFTKKALKKYKLHKICADYYHVNLGSKKIFSRSGYTIEGVFKDHFKLNNKYVHSVRVAFIR